MKGGTLVKDQGAQPIAAWGCHTGRGSSSPSLAFRWRQTEPTPQYQLLKRPWARTTSWSCSWIPDLWKWWDNQCLLLSTSKQRHHFAHQRPHCQSYGFSSTHVWMWELNYKERWVLENWCFWTVVSILKEISPEYSLEGLMLKLKLQYFSHLMQRTDSLEKTLMLGKIESSLRRGWQRMSCLDAIPGSM